MILPHRLLAAAPVRPLGLAALLTWSLSAVAESLRYELTPVPDQHQLQVELEWTTQDRTGSALCLASSWGRISDVPALIRSLRVDGGALRKQENACWVITHHAGATLRVAYVVDPGFGELGWDQVHFPVTTKSLFQGIAATFLLTPRPGAGGAPAEYEVVVRWRLPEKWSAACSFGGGPTVGARLTADALRHSAFLAGRIDLRHQSPAGGGEITVAMPERFDFNIGRFAEFATRIIAAQARFMEDDAFPAFVVLAIPVGEQAPDQTRLSGQGLHHSFVLWTSPGAKLTDATEHLFAHELFHHWNGQVLRAAEPTGEVLWFTEGFTDYYALRILFESGQWDAATYARWVNRHLRAYHANPARNVSNAQIAEKYWEERDTVGEVPYQRGLLLGLRWHRQAEEHGVTDGLDRLFRALVARGRTSEFKVSNAEIRKLGAELLGDWFTAEFDRYVHEAQTVDVPSHALAPALDGRLQFIYEYELGFERAASLRAQRIQGLKDGSAAEKAGLREGDSVVGWKIEVDPDQKVILQILRADRVQRISYYPRGERRKLLQFSPAN